MNARSLNEVASEDCRVCTKKSQQVFYNITNLYALRFYHNILDLFIDLTKTMAKLFVNSLALDPFVIVIVNSKLLKRHSKAKRRALAHSRALRQIRGVFQ